MSLEDLALRVVDDWMDAWSVSLSNDARYDLIIKISEYYRD